MKAHKLLWETMTEGQRIEKIMGSPKAKQLIRIPTMYAYIDRDETNRLFYSMDAPLYMIAPDLPGHPVIIRGKHYTLSMLKKLSAENIEIEYEGY